MADETFDGEPGPHQARLLSRQGAEPNRHRAHPTGICLGRAASVFGSIAGRAGLVAGVEPRASAREEQQEEESMNTFKIGDFVGSLATGSANRKLVEVLVLLAGGAIDTAASSDVVSGYVFSLWGASR